MHIVKLLLTATVLSLIPSQLLRLNLSQNSAINLTDIFVLILDSMFLITSSRSLKEVKAPKYLIASAILFILAASASTVLSLTLLSFSQVLQGSLFLIRIATYLVLPLVIINSLKKEKTQNYINLLILVGFIFATLGFLQIIIFPNLAPLEKYGWDPHINRLVSSTLDPNFTGMILTIFTAISLSKFLFQKKFLYLFLTGYFSLALVLTFSRSSYISFALVMFAISSLKSPKVILAPLLIFAAAFILIPSVKARIVGALTVDKTSRSRIESWQNASKIISDHPVFGIGFNNYRYFQSQYGFINYDESGGHSGSGVDSSLLLTMATTGLFGTIFYLGWLASIAKVAMKNIKTNYLSLALVSSLIALFIHSQFVNSLYFPQILMLLMVLTGIKYVQDY